MTTADPGRTPSGRNLHVSHSQSVDAARWIRVFAAHDRRSGNFVFESVGQAGEAFGCRVFEAGSGRLVAATTFTRPLTGTPVTHDEYRRAMLDLVRALDIDHVYVATLTGHTLDVFNLDVPVTQVHQDLSCWRAVTDAGANPGGVGFHDAYFERALRPHVSHVVPWAGTSHLLRRLDPRYARLTFALVPHGIEPAAPAFGGAQAGRRLRVAVVAAEPDEDSLGLLAAGFEGLRTFADLLIAETADGARFLARRWGVELAAREDPDGLRRTVCRFAPDVAVLLHSRRQPAGYRLTDLRAMGVPVAMPAGAPGSETIAPGSTGYLFERRSDRLVRLLAELDRERPGLREVARRLIVVPAPSAAEMVDEYYRLRRAS